MRTTQHKALVHRAVDVIWNRGKLDVADVVFAINYINHNGLIPDLLRGPEAIKFSVALYRIAFPDLQITVDDLTEDGDMVRLRWTAHGIAGAERAGDASAAGRVGGRLTCRMADGQIAESWVQWDREGASARLSLLP